MGLTPLTSNEQAGMVALSILRRYAQTGTVGEASSGKLHPTEMSRFSLSILLNSVAKGGTSSRGNSHLRSATTHRRSS